MCCPPNTYGPNCDPCPDCNGNGKFDLIVHSWYKKCVLFTNEFQLFFALTAGKCKGNGTRKGNGKCTCDTGYSGEFCSECAVQYYESFRDEKNLLCSPCHNACSIEGCTGGGAKSIDISLVTFVSATNIYLYPQYCVQ